MAAERSLIPHGAPIAWLTADNEDRHEEAPVAATRDHALIQRWAHRHQAEPATGEETASGSASMPVINDGDAGIRFNFPAAGRFRPISWEEWFGNFEQHELVFVYERATPGSQGSSYRLTKLATLQNDATLV